MPEERTFKARAAQRSSSVFLSKVNKANARVRIVNRSHVRAVRMRTPSAYDWARNHSLLLFRLFRNGSRSGSGRRRHRRHGLDRARLTEKLDLNRLFTPSIGPDYVATKYQAGFFNGYELAIKKRFAWIDNVGELDRYRFDHRGPTARSAKDTDDLHFTQQQSGRRLWRGDVRAGCGQLLCAIPLDAHLDGRGFQLTWCHLCRLEDRLVLLERI